MRWNDLRCDHLLNWICEIKKGIIASPFNWSNKPKLKKQTVWIQTNWKEERHWELFILKPVAMKATHKAAEWMEILLLSLDAGS